MNAEPGELEMGLFFKAGYGDLAEPRAATTTMTTPEAHSTTSGHRRHRLEPHTVMALGASDHRGRGERHQASAVRDAFQILKLTAGQPRRSPDAGHVASQPWVDIRRLLLSTAPSISSSRLPRIASGLGRGGSSTADRGKAPESARRGRRWIGSLLYSTAGGAIVGGGSRPKDARGGAHLSEDRRGVPRSRFARSRWTYRWQAQTNGRSSP